MWRYAAISRDAMVLTCGVTARRIETGPCHIIQSVLFASVLVLFVREGAFSDQRFYRLGRRLSRDDRDACRVRPGLGRRHGRLSRDTIRFGHARTSHEHLQEMMRVSNSLMCRSVAACLINDRLKRIHCLCLGRQTYAEGITGLFDRSPPATLRMKSKLAAI
jgi:hypothetical protein